MSTIFIRTIIIYAFVLAAIRLMGKERLDSFNLMS